MYVQEEHPGSFTSSLRAGIKPEAGAMEYIIIRAENGLKNWGGGSAFSRMRIQLDHVTGISETHKTTTRIIATANDVKCFQDFSKIKRIEGQGNKK
jgi:hypothetical protein